MLFFFTSTLDAIFDNTVNKYSRNLTVDIFLAK
jgi:hypothetical protein